MSVPYSGVRYDPSARVGHVESYFLKANDPARPRALWLKATIFASAHAPRRAVAEAWAVAFDRERGHVAVKSWVPYEAARFSPVDFSAAIDGCSYGASAVRGSITTAERTIAWDLRYRDASAPLYHYPRKLYEARLPSQKLVSLCPDATFEGKATVRGETWSLDGWRGMVGHNWGRKHTALYAWAHCNVWDGPPDPEIVFEGVSGRVALGPVLTPTRTLLFVRHRGVRYDLNGTLDLLRNQGEITPRRYRFRGESDLAFVQGELWGESDDFVGLYYPNPDGAMTYCLNTKIAQAELRFRPRGRDEMVLRSSAAALEIGTRDPNHGVRMYV